MEDFVGAKFYCPHSLAGGNQRTRIREKTLEFSSTVLSTLSAYHTFYAFSAMTLLDGRQEGQSACKKTEWWGAGVVICLERVADLMPLPITVPCFSKIQIGFTFLVPALPGSPGKRVVKRSRARACVCVSVRPYLLY